MESENLPLVAYNSGALDGLNGSISATLRRPQDITTLREACEKCHPALVLDLTLYNDYHDSRLRDLADCAPVLKRVRRLDPGFIDTRELFSDDGSCLDAICENHDIALVMKHRGEYRRLFEKSAHIR